jgi:osmotically-inducible protein OsmY
MRRYPLWVGTIGLAVLAMATSGCDDTAKGVKKDTEENAEAAKPYVDAAAAKAKEKLKEAAENAKPAAEEAGEKLKELGDKAVEGAKDLGDKASDKMAEGAHKAEDKTATGAEKAEHGAEKAGEKASDAGDAVSAAAQTTMVKAALMADKDVDASGIDVDTEAATRTVMLKGTVPTAAQKASAERIAKGKVSKGYSVHNMLTVAPKS